MHQVPLYSPEYGKGAPFYDSCNERHIQNIICLNAACWPLRTYHTKSQKKGLRTEEGPDLRKD